MEGACIDSSGGLSAASSPLSNTGGLLQLLPAGFVAPEVRQSLQPYFRYAALRNGHNLWSTLLIDKFVFHHCQEMPHVV